MIYYLLGIMYIIYLIHKVNLLFHTAYRVGKTFEFEKKMFIFNNTRDTNYKRSFSKLMIILILWIIDKY